MTELKPTAADERAAWKPYASSRELRLMADVDRLEKWVCDLHAMADVGKEAADTLEELDRLLHSDDVSAFFRAAAVQGISLSTALGDLFQAAGARREAALTKAREAGLLEGEKP